MTTSPEALVEDVLSRMGWPTTRITPGLYRCEGVGERRKSLMVRIDPAGYVAAAIVPIAPSPRDSKKAALLYKRLLELNHQLLMVRFCIDDDLDVILSVEHPSADLDATELEAALDLLAHYIDAHGGEIQALAEA
jgi:hypothetical protein